MQTKFKLLVSFILCITFVHAQKITFQSGAPFAVKTEDALIEKVLSYQPNQAAILERDKDGFRFIGFNDKQTSLVQQPIELPQIPNKKTRYFYAEQMEDRIYFFTTYFDPYLKEITLYSSDLDVKKGRFLKHKPLMSLKDPNLNTNSQPFTVLRSADSTHLLFYTLWNDNNSNNIGYKVVVTNNLLNEVYKADITLNCDKKLWDLHGIALDKTNQIWFLNSVKETTAKNWSDRKYTETHTYNPTTKKVITRTFEDNELILNPTWMINKNHELSIQGFYTKRAIGTIGADGYFIAKQENDQFIIQRVPFSNETITQLQQQLENEPQEIFPFHIRSSYDDPKSLGHCIVAEEFKKTYEVDKNGVPQTEKVLFGDVLVLFLSPAYHVERSFLRSKTQLSKWKYTTDDKYDPFLTVGKEELPYMGICTLYDNGQLILFFNDHPSNPMRRLKKRDEKSLRNEESVTIQDTYRKTGFSETKVFFPKTDKSDPLAVRIMPNLSNHLSNKEIILFSRKNRNLKLTRIQLVIQQ